MGGVVLSSILPSLLVSQSVSLVVHYLSLPADQYVRTSLQAYKLDIFHVTWRAVQFGARLYDSDY